MAATFWNAWALFWKLKLCSGSKKNLGSFHLCNCDQASLERGQKQGGLSTSFQFIAHLNLIRLKSFFSYVTKKNFGKSTFSASVLSPLVSEVCCDSNLADVSAGNESSRWSWREAGGGRGGWPPPPLDWRQIHPSSLSQSHKNDSFVSIGRFSLSFVTKLWTIGGCNDRGSVFNLSDQLGFVRRKQITRWQHLTRMKNDSYH